MRKILAVSVVALLAFAGQAMADDGGFSLPFCTPIQPGASANDDARLFNDCTGATISIIGGMIVAIALVVDNNDHSKSP